MFFSTTLAVYEKCLNGDSNPDLCNAGAVLYQLSYQANWELVVMWVNDQPIYDGYRSILQSVFQSAVLIHEIHVFDITCIGFNIVIIIENLNVGKGKRWRNGFNMSL